VIKHGMTRIRHINTLALWVHTMFTHLVLSLLLMAVYRILSHDTLCNCL
jgi:hypothetical protein